MFMLSREELLISLNKQFTKTKYLMKGNIRICVTTTEEEVKEFETEIKKEFVNSRTIIESILSIYDGLRKNGIYIRELGVIANICYSFS